MNPTNEPGVKRGKWRFLKILGIVVIVLVALVAALPSIISMGVVRRAVLAKASAATGGKVAIESWSFGWLAGTHIDGIEFTDARGLSVRVKSVSTSKGLLGLAGGTKTLGDVVVESPEVDVTVPEKMASATVTNGAVPAVPVMAIEKTTPSTAPAVAQKPAEPIKVPVDFSGTIKVRNGKAIIRIPGTATPRELRDLNVAITIDSLNNKPVAFDVALAEGAGTLHLAGSVKAFENGTVVPAKLQADVKCEIGALNLAPLTALAAGAGNVPNVEGTLDSAITLKVRGLESVSAEGFVRLANLVASGSVLGTDRPSLEKVKLDFDVAMDGQSVKVKTLNVDSPVLTLTAAGALSDKGATYPVGAIHAETKVDLARLAHELPATLKLGKGVSVSRGSLSAKVDVESKGDALTCALQAALADVEAVQNGQARKLDSPVTASAAVSLDKAGPRMDLMDLGAWFKALVASLDKASPRLDRLEVSSAFANANGRGDLKDLSLALKVDLAAATREAAKFVDLGGLTASGTIDATARIRSASDQTRQVEATLGIDQLKIAGKTPNPVVLDAMKAVAECKLVSDAQGALTEISAVRVTVDSDPVSAEATVARVKPGKTTEDTEIQDISAKVHASIGKLVALGHGIGLMPAGFTGQGDVNVAAKAAMAKGLVSLESLSLAVAGLQVSPAAGKRFAESNLTFAATAQVNLAHRSATVTEARLAWSSGAVNLPLVRLGDWNRNPPDIEGKVAAKVNIERLLAQLPGFVNLPPGTVITGTIEAEAAAAAAGTVRTVTLDGTSKDLTFKAPDSPVIVESGLKIGLQAEQNATSGDLTLKRLQLVSSEVEFSATGTLAHVSTSCDLGLDGSLTCDFKRIGDLVALLTGVKLDMDGRRPESFSVRVPLAGKDLKDTLQKLKANAGVYMAQAAAFGVRMTNTEFRVTADKGLVRADIGTRVNEGDLKVDATVDANGRALVLTMPTNSWVLHDVKITEEMMSQLVDKVSPVLSGCGVTSGAVDLMMRQCTVPLDATWTNATTVQGDLSLKGVVLAAGGTVGTILGLVGQSTTQVTLSNQTVSFSCADGKISTSPLTLACGGFRMTISGYAMLDGRLNYVAEVPMTEKLVGSKNYAYAKDIVIKIPIEGTAAKPVIGAGAVQAAVAEVIKKAGTEVLIDKGTKALEGWLQKAKFK